MVIEITKRMKTKMNYIAPAIDTVEIEAELLMLTTSGETGEAGTGSGSAGDGPELANDRRGSWGNLWN